MTADITGEIGGALGLRGATRNEQVAAAARHLTSVFMRQLIDQMWKTVPEGGLIPASTGERVFRDFMSDKLASDLSRKVAVDVPGRKSSRHEPLQNGAPGTDTGKGGGSHGHWMG